MAEYEEFGELAEALQEVEEMGYIETHRSGNTGIGKTLEDLLGIEENNEQLADAVGAEIKAGRRDSGSRTTLFTKEPPRSDRDIWASDLVEKYGYTDDKGRPALKITLHVDDYNNQGFRVLTDSDGLHVEHEDDGILATYPPDFLKEAYQEKVPEMVLVDADRKTIDGNEYFWYNEAYHLHGFDAEDFLNLIRESIIKIELRLHLRDSGGARNHGTAFRIRDKTKLDRAFEERDELFNTTNRNPDITENPQKGITDF
jgi:hypothetical protein